MITFLISKSKVSRVTLNGKGKEVFGISIINRDVTERSVSFIRNLVGKALEFGFLLFNCPANKILPE